MSISLKKTILFFFFIVSIQAWSNIPDRPRPARLVNDFAGIFDAQQKAELERFLTMVDDSTSNQMVIVTTKDLGMYDKSQFATELGQKWGVGNAEFDNGIVLLIKPKIGNQSGQVFIAVGYGLEGAIPDAITKRIIEEITIPYFRQNDYYGGARATVEQLYKIAKGEINMARKPEANYGRLVFIIIMIIVFLIIASKSKNKPNDNGNGTHTSYGGLPWLIGGGLAGSGGGRSSGGGFGGFGGGGFGGGGGGGSW
ncbi:MAG: TPM domain-containing protein [Paludibacteraceae bacterium]|nr:TPM domain-containing protein [Paludibacteraceae bacterium]MBP6284589.1 TPM domain-containing protein [Paludibacteraceae bacterium]